jgi:MoxR-like ATPase
MNRSGTFSHDVQETLEIVEKIERQVDQVIVGQAYLIRHLLMGLFTKIAYGFKRGGVERSGGGHVILEGVPGVAKTLAVLAIANSIQAQFQRIQFSPDLMPADIVGTRVYDATLGNFRVEKGPIFANVILADEINRATQKTQSALLEAMQERQVTIGDATFQLAEPFWVLATQNPVEQEGVYPLPEAQLDRFAMMLKVGYPEKRHELEMLDLAMEKTEVAPVIGPGEVVAIRDQIHRIYVHPRIREYVVRLGRATRATGDDTLPLVREMVQHGASPRSYHHLLSLARTAAFFEGRDCVLPEDVKSVVIDCWQHRLIRTIQAEAENVGTQQILQEVLDRTPIP